MEQPFKEMFFTSVDYVIHEIHKIILYVHLLNETKIRIVFFFEFVKNKICHMELKKPLYINND